MSARRKLRVAAVAWLCYGCGLTLAAGITSMHGRWAGCLLVIPVVLGAPVAGRMLAALQCAAWTQEAREEEGSGR